MGSAGQVDYITYRKLAHGDIFALFAISGQPAFASGLLLLAMVSAILFGIGVVPRITGWLFLLTTFATLDRTPAANDAGQTLLLLLLFILCFMDTSRALCAFTVSPFKQSWAIEALGNTLHNAGRFLIAWQICMVYFWAAFWKIAGEEWRNGTALSYILHIERFQVVPSLSIAVAGNALAVAFLTYFTLIFQMGFPFLMWNQRVKPYVIAIGITLHIGIAVFLGLVSFSAVMIVADISLLSDQQFARVAAVIRKMMPAKKITSAQPL